MLDLRPVIQVVGSLLVILAVSMAAPALADAAAGRSHWAVFVTAGAVTAFVGAAMVLSCRSESIRFQVRHGFLMTTLAWIFLPAFAALPLWFSDLSLSYTDAYFEAMSGITTTGSTVISGLDLAPPGVLLWRSLLQWLGGIGIIIMALTVLPALRVGGMQMFKVEAFETSEKVLPRAASLASALTSIYVILTLLWTVMYWLAGMTLFEAFNHAMTTIATGGYSTSDQSFAKFNSALIDGIAVAGMLVGSIPFLLYFQAVRGRPLLLLRDTQVQVFILTVILSVSGVALYLAVTDPGYHGDPWLALRHASFNTISVMTGTGYASTDFWAWGGIPVAALFCLMFVGGCAGSTTCGIKIFRFQVLFAESKIQIQKLLQPHAVLIPYYNHRPIEAGVPEAVLAFFFLFALFTTWLAMALGAFGLDFVTALSAAATAMANVGPGLGDVIGPAGNFSSLPDGAKWLMCLGMLLGRLELFTVLVLFLPSFWRG